MTIKTINVYVKGNGTQSYPYEDTFYYFGTTTKFKTIKSFKEFLKEKYPFAIFKFEKA